MTEEELLHKLLESSLKYTPIVYQQSSFNVDRNAFGNGYVLEYKFENIPADSLLFFVPIMSCNGPSTLNVRTPLNNNTYKDNVFEVLVETNDGKMRKAQLGDIIAYRMCIFRFKKGTSKIVLCNSPLYDEAAFSRINVNKAKFDSIPEVGDDGDTLALQSDFNKALDRIDALEKKFKFGTDDPEDALENEPAGTVYIQIEKD